MCECVSPTLNGRAEELEPVGTNVSDLCGDLRPGRWRNCGGGSTGPSDCGLCANDGSIVRLFQDFRGAFSFRIDRSVELRASGITWRAIANRPRAKAKATCNGFVGLADGVALNKHLSIGTKKRETCCIPVCNECLGALMCVLECGCMSLP